MKKNLLLYILLIFLILVNGFFLYNYLGKGIGNENKRHRTKDPLVFFSEQLNFNDSQKEKVKLLNDKHRNTMMQISRDVKGLKDVLFSYVFNDSIAHKKIDSLTALIGFKEAELEKEAFYHFRTIENICTSKQNKKLKKILKDAIGRGPEKNGPPHKIDNDHRPPPPTNDHHRPPPMH